MHRSPFENDATVLCRALPQCKCAAPATPQPDLVTTEPDLAANLSVIIKSPDAIVERPRGRGAAAPVRRADWEIAFPVVAGNSAHSAIMAIEAKQSSNFWASARMIKRVLKWSSTTDHSVAEVPSRDSSSGIDDPANFGCGDFPGLLLELRVAHAVKKPQVFSAHRRIFREALKKVFAPSKILPVSLREQFQQTFRSSRWSAAQATKLRQAEAVEIARAISTLARVATSLCGLPSAATPTRPPGEFMRTHPRVPRGPSTALWDLRPAGGVLSTG
ncbi:hypothetical protein [Actinoplanes sp. NPDC051859]|uniref:hypothetical protein n=1 Tax=Actinoplanes sp. NPDC051859 TaxID=3363909 RepID=UPI0037BE0AB9